ncbi:MAG: hypothetical protein ACKO33_06960 [Bacteroidota bacterium]|nr:hypothetical protein [Bacteroidota bacterium]
MFEKKKLFTLGLCLFAITATGFCQNFVGKSAAWCKENRSRSLVKPSLIYNHEKICIREVYFGKEMAVCEKLVVQLTKDPTYGWIRINENQWVSKFEDQLLVEVHEAEKGCRTQVHRTAWTKELYELLLKNE